MICQCGQACIRGYMRWAKTGGWLCTRCGRLVRLDYKTGRVREYWRSRRYGAA